MHTDEKMPAGDGNPTAGYTDAAIVTPTDAAVALTAKEFATLRAQFALHGHTPHRQGDDGSSGLHVARSGLVRALPTADDARRFLAQIGGHP